MTNEEVIQNWRKRDHTADIIRKNPKIYNSWRAFRFTQRGKKIGNSPEWNEFKTFYNDMYDTYIINYKLIRLNKDKPFSKDNCIWASDTESSILRRNSAKLTHEGQTKTLLEWAAFKQLSFDTIRNRYYKHPEYTSLEILFGKQKKRKDKIVKDWKQSSNGIRSKASKMVSSYKHKDLKMNLKPCDITIEWMIDNIILSKCIYCGDTERIGADRIDNDKGHTMDNVVPCCYACNCARNRNFTYNEMLLIGETIKKVKANRK